MSRGSYNTAGSTQTDRYIQGKRKPETQDPGLSWGQSLSAAEGKDCKPG